MESGNAPKGKDGDKMEKKYIGIYVRRNLIAALLCAGIAVALMLVASLTNDAVPNDILISLIPLPIALCWFLLSLIPIIGFRKMIKQQEKQYGICFEDAEVIHLENGLYLSRNWLIVVGRCGLYKKHIRKMKQKFIVEKGGSVYRIRILVEGDRRYTIRCRNEANVKKIRNWAKKV